MRTILHSTFHSVYISTLTEISDACIILPLHSTLFILVLLRFRVSGFVFIISTFHSVYISTVFNTVIAFFKVPLHSTLFILVHPARLRKYKPELTLHSTLFILVLVSIQIQLPKNPPLHSTLFILVRNLQSSSCIPQNSTFHSVYISTLTGGVFL